MYKISIFKSENFCNTLCLILISLLPLSLIIGSLIVNIFCILIIFLFLFESVKEKNFDFIRSNEFLILLLFWFFLLINTFLSTSFQNSVGRGFGFIRFILLVFALRYYFTLNNHKYFNFIKLSWLIIFVIITFDLLFESYFGFNMMGFKNDYPGRLSGFLNQELNEIIDVLKVNGIRFSFKDGSWGLIRASSNKPSLVVVTESPTSNERKKKIFEFIDNLLQKTGKIGKYDQKI